LITTRTWEAQRITHQFPWVPEGVKMRAADVPYHNKMGVGRRALAFGQYAAYALREGLRIDKPDVIWGISTPLTAAWAAAQVARLRRVPWVFEVQDLWPSFPIAMGAVPNGFAQRELYKLERKLYQQAKAIMTLSPDMTEFVQEVGMITKSPWPFKPDKVHTILNGTDFHLAAAATDVAVTNLRQEQGLIGRRVVLYAGTFGRANDIPTLVAAAEKMAPSHPDVTWLFMGHGFHEPLIRAATARCAGIRLIAPQPRHAVFAWFKLAEVSVVSFLNLPVLDANSPAKFYDSLAVGTPVVVTNNGWTKKWVEYYNCGWYTPANDASTMTSCISGLLATPATLRQAGERGKTAALLHFDRQMMAAEIQEILETAASNTN
jgi:glycosyltransferase involved in cell wall biosynthesis